MGADAMLRRLVELGEELYADVDLEDKEASLLESLRSVGEETRSRVCGVLDEFDELDLEGAIERLGRAREQLLAGRSVGELDDEEIANYSELGNLKLVLSARRVRMAAEGGAFEWFVEDALPVLRRVAPVLLGLLV